MGGVLLLPLVTAWAAGTNSVARPGLRDIRGPLEIRSMGDILRLGLLVAALAALLGVAWWWWRRRRKAESPTVSVHPEERAQARLAEALAFVDQPERFCTLVSEIVRTYLEERFGLKAPERTTEEFLVELAKSAALESHHKSFLAEFLTQCDLAKFARATPARNELEDLHGAASRLVRETAAAVPIPPTLSPPVLSEASS